MKIKENLQIGAQELRRWIMTMGHSFWLENTIVKGKLNDSKLTGLKVTPANREKDIVN